MHGLKRFIIVAVAAVSLGGCETLSGFVGNIEKSAPQIEKVVDEVSTFTQRLCGFRPIAATIANIFAGSSVTSAFDVAKLVCEALSTQNFAATKKVQKVTIVVQGASVTGFYTPPAKRKR